MMKALQYNTFGGTEVLHWQEEATPQPAAGQVLVLVKAASLNPTESKIRMGFLSFPGLAPFPKHLGMDFAGTVAKIGDGVTHVKIGDAVMGYMGANGGAFGDYALAEAKNTFLKPNNLSFEEATTLPMNAATALKVTNEYVKPAAGKTILVNGASGGLGLFVVQLCKLAGAVVSGTASGEESLKALASVGVDEVIDYKQTDVLKSDKTWDAILDTTGKLDFDQAKTLLAEYGEFSTLVPKSDPSKPGRTDGTKKENLINAVPGQKEFEASQTLAAEGKLKTFVGKTFPMLDAAEAMAQFESGKLNVVGKVVLVA